jgi:hypothetical protein
MSPQRTFSTSGKQLERGPALHTVAYILAIILQPPTVLINCFSTQLNCQSAPETVCCLHDGGWGLRCCWKRS